MEIVNIALNGCADREVLASDVCNDNGVILAARGTVMNSFIKGKLQNIGIEKICIYNNNKVMTDRAHFREEYGKAVFQVKALLNDLAAGKKFDFESYSKICGQIYKCVRDNETVIKYLQEIHSSDEYTYSHCLNTSFYSVLLGRWLKLSEEEVKKVLQAGLLHDIGKMRIPEEILCKKEKLSQEEYEIIKKHPVFGFQMMEGSEDVDNEIKLAVLQHHERIDCSGYPYGISAHKVNQYAKIVAVVDVFDAMTSDRVYKKRVTPFDTFEMFQTIGVGIFDTHILKTFLKNIVVYYTNSKVLLNTGHTGEIVYIPPHDIIHPVVMADERYIDLSSEEDIKIAEII